MHLIFNISLYVYAHTQINKWMNEWIKKEFRKKKWIWNKIVFYTF